MREPRGPVLGDPAAEVVRHRPIPVAAGVVAAWAGINAVLVAMLAGFDGLSVPLLIYGSATVIVVAVALAVLWCERRDREPRRVRWRPYADAVPLVAIGAVIGGLALAFGWWLAPIAGVVFVLAIVTAAVARQRVP